MFEHVFSWPFNPSQFEKTIKTDPRFRNNPVGYVAIENNHIIGFVGVMDIATRTLDGAEENVGGIWGVVTHPIHARKGVFTALMTKSHEYFKEKRFKFSFLYTSRTLIAYALYQKLGYADAVIYPSVYKVAKKPEKPAEEIGEKVNLDWNKVLKIHKQATKNRTGFVIRDKQYGEMLETREKIQPEKSVITERGYALLSENEGNVRVQELIAPTREEISELIIQIEEKTAKTVVDKIVIDKKTVETYQSHGFMILRNSYDRLMSKPFTDVTFAEAYGQKFYATSVDSF